MKIKGRYQTRTRTKTNVHSDTWLIMSAPDLLIALDEPAALVTPPYNPNDAKATYNYYLATSHMHERK